METSKEPEECLDDFEMFKERNNENNAEDVKNVGKEQHDNDLPSFHNKPENNVKKFE